MNENDTPRRIVVGVDGSQNSAHAAQWAAEEAALRGAELHLVHGLNFTIQAEIISPLPVDEARARIHSHAKKIIDEVRAPLTAAHPGLNITAEISELSPSEALVTSSKDAQLVVTGSRGHGGFTGLLLGSVGLKVASHAHCPTVVVRP